MREAGRAGAPLFLRNNVGVPFSSDYKVQWRVTNTDKAAYDAGQLRGGFYNSDAGMSREEGLLPWRALRGGLSRPQVDQLVGRKIGAVVRRNRVGFGDRRCNQTAATSHDPTLR